MSRAAQQTRDELVALKISALMKRATAAGIPQDVLADAMDTDSPNDVLADLIIEAARFSGGENVPRLERTANQHVQVVLRSCSPPTSPPRSPPRAPIRHTLAVGTSPARPPPRILKPAEYSRALLISHNRRDPAALNATYAIVRALRHELSLKTGQPFSRHCYIGPDGTERTTRTCELWTDKEQLAESGGADWQEPIIRAAVKGVATIFFLGNAFCGSGPCMEELRFVTQQRLPAIPVLLETLHRTRAGFDGWLECRQGVPGGVISDAALQDFEEWKVKVGVEQFWTGGMQGVDLLLDQQQMDTVFLCDNCRDTRDQPCCHCTDWGMLRAN
eukprot:SAG22_NODE_1313_length_4774_cov_31.746310_5_plen_331_part_00